MDVTVIVSLCDCQSHCIFDSEVTVIVTVSVSIGVIALFVDVIVCDCHSLHHCHCGDCQYPCVSLSTVQLCHFHWVLLSVCNVFVSWWNSDSKLGAQGCLLMCHLCVCVCVWQHCGVLCQERCWASAYKGFGLLGTC